MKTRPFLVVLFCLFWLLAPWPVSAEPAHFYKGKTVRVVIGTEPGTAYDLYARLVVRHIGKYIPGEPAVIAQNMPGAGSLNAYNYLYNVAPRDGTTFGIGHRFVPLMPLLGLPGALFDGRRFTYIGSANREVDVCMARTDSGIRSIEDLRVRELLVGTTGSGAELTTYYGTIRKLLGGKLRVVSGYRSQNDLYLAIERGEIQGRCGGSYLNLTSEHPHWLPDRFVTLWMQIGQRKDRAIPNVPLILDLVKDPEDRQALDLMLSPNSMGRPFVAPPEVPQDRAKALRDSFNKAMRDPDLLAEAKAQSLDIDPITGEEMSRLIENAYAAPKEPLERARALVGGK